VLRPALRQAKAPGNFIGELLGAMHGALLQQVEELLNAYFAA